jgi:hypothetical protein
MGQHANRTRASHLAERRVTEAIRDDRGRILALCNPRETWSPRRASDARRDIRFGLHRYIAVGGGREADVRVVDGPSGAYLRSDWDDTSENNLDELRGASSGNALTGLSEVALQVSEAAAERLVRAMHRAGATLHQGLTVSDDRRVELTLGAPESITLVPTDEDETEARARVEIPVLYHSRSLSDAGDPGDDATALLHVRARVASQAAPTGIQLFIDWSETQDDDVDVTGPNGARVARDIATFARAQGAMGRDVQLPGLAGRARISELTTTFRRESGRNLVAVTISFGSSPPDNRQAAPGEVFLERDWALALSEHLVTERIRDGLEQDVGALPPPFGDTPVVLPGTTDLFLDSFDVLLADGAIVFEGTLRRPGPPVVTASYRAEVELQLSGGNVQATVRDVTVQTNEWYASLADFISGGAIRAAVERGLRQALGAGAGGRLSTLFSGDLLSEVAAVNTSRTINAEPVLEDLEVRDAGIVAQGSLEVMDLAAPPVAEFAVLPVRGAPRDRILHAGGSWAPGGQLTAFSWTLGDGDSEELSGAQTRFVLEHTYPPGTYTAQLTVVNDRGESTSAAQVLEVE